MTGAAHHRLVGFEPDNFLAFMALLGLLRALETARPAWHARAWWDETRPPPRPVLALKTPQGEQEIAQAAAEGVAALAQAHEFGDRKDINHTPNEARAVLAEAGAGGLGILDALFSDGAVRDNGRVWPTPLCFLFGQGHQHFLERLEDIPRGRLPKKLARLKRPPDLTDKAFIERTLFNEWTREDSTDGLRWDPAEDRRYALRARDPSGDPAGQQHGANRLAAIGLAALPGTVIPRRGETRFLNTGTAYGPDRQIVITWPVWNRPARLAAIRALIAHPDLAANRPDPSGLAEAGIIGAWRARRISVGKFVNITTAERIL